ncbi:MAG: hypothetical protein AB8C84_09725 [Oligoflexales bacterium]
MSNCHASDTIRELASLAHEIALDIRQHLNYYRASVYKHEAASLIREKIDSLRSLVDLIPDEAIHEPLRDYDSEQQSSTQLTPGETLFTMQVSRLLNSLEQQLQYAMEKSQDSAQNINLDILIKEKIKILSLCRQGSHPWQFFKNL